MVLFIFYVYTIFYGFVRMPRGECLEDLRVPILWSEDSMLWEPINFYCLYNIYINKIEYQGIPPD